MPTNVGPSAVLAIDPTKPVPADTSAAALLAVRAMLADGVAGVFAGRTREPLIAMLADHNFRASKTSVSLLGMFAKIIASPITLFTLKITSTVFANPAAFTTFLASAPPLAVLANASSFACFAVIFLDTMLTQRSLSLLRYRVARHC